VHKKTLVPATELDAKPEANGLWGTCMLQTYFTAKGRIDYFMVVDDEKGGSEGQGPVPSTEPQEAYLREAEKDFEKVKGDIVK
jgi:hypothetical protein